MVSRMQVLLMALGITAATVLFIYVLATATTFDFTKAGVLCGPAQLSAVPVFPPACARLLAFLLCCQLRCGRAGKVVAQARRMASGCVACLQQPGLYSSGLA